MIDEEIVNTFKQFTRINMFEYFENSMPYRPYGEIYGRVENNVFKIYIHQYESRLSRRFNTVFEILGLDLFPKGFCIEHEGDGYGKKKHFGERIKIRSNDVEVVNRFLNDKIKSILIYTFNEINDIEKSLFKARCFLRMSDEGIILSVDKVFKDFNELNIAFSSATTLLSSLISELSKTIKRSEKTGTALNK